MNKKPGCNLVAVLLLSLISIAFPRDAIATLENIEVLVTPDVEDAPGEAHFVIHFEHPILYQRHTPKDEGNLLQVFVRLVGVDPKDTGIFEETLWTKKQDRVPVLKATFPYADNSLLISFSQSTKYSVRPGSDGRSLVVSVPLLPIAKDTSQPIPVVPSPVAKPLPVETAKLPVEPQTPEIAKPEPQIIKAEPTQAPSKPSIQATEDTELLANKFMTEARRAMEKKDYATAINRCYRILGLEPNSQTEPAQAWIGEVREANGEISKARAEYELYLKLYPAGPNAARVRERLAALPKVKETVAAPRVRELPKEAGPAEWTYFGNVSAYYYHGQSQIETITTPLPGQLPNTQPQLSAVDQDSLITSVNLNARRRDAFSDTRIVVRNTDNRNFLTPKRSYNRLYSAYVERTDRKEGYFFRVGRQNPNGMGVLERFDGAQVGYNLNPSWRVNGVYGEAVEFLSPFTKVFYGGSVDLLPEIGRPGVSVYAINQTLDGLLNRRALGTEVRYFDGHATVYGLLDYDVLYKGVNIALMQGNYLTDSGANYYFVLDHRQAPSYSLTNALLGAPGVGLKDLVATEGLDKVREQAKGLSPVSNLFSMGVTFPLNDRWQLGTDYQLSRISSTQPIKVVLPLGLVNPCIGVIDDVNQTCVIDTDAQHGSGNTHAVTVQAVGSNLFYENAVGVGSLSYINAPTYDGQSLLLNYTLPFQSRWRFDTYMRYYTQKDKVGGHLSRFSPSFKLSYAWQNGWYLEGEVGEEVTKTTTVTTTERGKRDYFYLGLRWEFR